MDRSSPSVQGGKDVPGREGSLKVQRPRDLGEHWVLEGTKIENSL